MQLSLLPHGLPFTPKRPQLKINTSGSFGQLCGCYASLKCHMHASQPCGCSGAFKCRSHTKQNCGCKGLVKCHAHSTQACGCNGSIKCLAHARQGCGCSGGLKCQAHSSLSCGCIGALKCSAHSAQSCGCRGSVKCQAHSTSSCGCRGSVKCQAHSTSSCGCRGSVKCQAHSTRISCGCNGAFRCSAHSAQVCGCTGAFKCQAHSQRCGCNSTFTCHAHASAAPTCKQTSRRDVLNVAGIVGAAVLLSQQKAIAAGQPQPEPKKICEADCEAKLADIKEVKTASGLRYKDIVVGKGPTPPTGYQIVADYVAMTADGKVFDSSLDRGRPYDLRVGSGQIVPGLDEGVASMRAGGLRRIYVPGNLGFPKGLPSGPGRPRVPPASPIMFDVKLLFIPGLEDEEE